MIFIEKDPAVTIKVTKIFNLNKEIVPRKVFELSVLPCSVNECGRGKYTAKVHPKTKFRLPQIN